MANKFEERYARATEESGKRRVTVTRTVGGRTVILEIRSSDGGEIVEPADIRRALREIGPQLARGLKRGAVSFTVRYCLQGSTEWADYIGLWRLQQ